MGQFSFLFGEATQQQGDEQLEDYSIQGQFSKRWGWFNAFYTLSDGDATKFKQTAQISLFTALTYLSYIKDKNDTETRLHKQRR